LEINPSFGVFFLAKQNVKFKEWEFVAQVPERLPIGHSPSDDTAMG
jgi:hypothetical protein